MRWSVRGNSTLSGNAAVAFEKVVSNAPHWTPGKINRSIALFNTNTAETKDRAIKLFQEVLKAEPKNPYAHYCLGILFGDHGDVDAAQQHFAEVSRIDPEDPDTWYQLGQLESNDETKRIEYYKKARIGLFPSAALSQIIFFF